MDPERNLVFRWGVAPKYLSVQFPDAAHKTTALQNVTNRQVSFHGIYDEQEALWKGICQIGRVGNHIKLSCGMVSHREDNTDLQAAVPVIFRFSPSESPLAKYLEDPATVFADPHYIHTIPIADDKRAVLAEVPVQSGALLLATFLVSAMEAAVGTTSSLRNREGDEMVPNDTVFSNLHAITLLFLTNGLILKDELKLVPGFSMNDIVRVFNHMHPHPRKACFDFCSNLLHTNEAHARRIGFNHLAQGSIANSYAVWYDDHHRLPEDLEREEKHALGEELVDALQKLQHVLQTHRHLQGPPAPNHGPSLAARQLDKRLKRNGHPR